MFRAYQTSLEFLQDNRSMLQKDPLQTVFFEENARNMPQITDRFQGFAVKIEQDGKTLLAARRLHFPMVLYGDSGLCGPLSEELAGRISALGAKATPCSSTQEGLDRALATAGPQDVVCACGSLYMIGEVRHLLGLC